MPKQHGSTDSEIKPTERRSEEEEYNPVSTTNSITKVQKEEYLIKKRLLFGNKVLSLQTE